MLYEEETKNNNKGKWITFGIRALLVVAFVFLLLWLFPLVNSRFNGNNEDPSVFNTNIKAMKDAAIAYLTNDKLPTRDGDIIRLSLQDMEDMNIVMPFLDRTGASCNKEESHVKVTKEGAKYKFEAFLYCPSSNERDNFVTWRGCDDLCPRENVCLATTPAPAPRPPATNNNNNQPRRATEFLMRRAAQHTTIREYQARRWVAGGVTEFEHTREVCRWGAWVLQPETTVNHPVSDSRRLVSSRTATYTNFGPWVLQPEQTTQRATSDTVRLHSTRTETRRVLTGFTPWSANRYTSGPRPAEGDLQRVVGQINGGPNCDVVCWIFQTRDPIWGTATSTFFRYEVRERTTTTVRYFTFETRQRICDTERTWSTSRTISGWTATGRTRQTAGGAGRWVYTGWVNRATYDNFIRSGYQHANSRSRRIVTSPETFRWFNTNQVSGWTFTGTTR